MTITKVLTFRASSIGDCLMAKYLLDNVHAQFPEARCGIVVASRGTMIKDLLAQYPWIEVIEANRKSPKAIWRVLREWWGSDLVVTQYAGKVSGQFSFTTKLMARLVARHGGLLGFTDSFRYNAVLYDTLVPLEPIAPAELERRVLRAAGLAVPLLRPTLNAATDSRVLEKYAVTPGGYCIVHLFSGSDKRGLSPENRHALVSHLCAVLPESIAVVLTAGAIERMAASEAVVGTRAKVIAQDVSLTDMHTLLAQSSMVVSLDTGVAHMTAQLGHPLTVLSTCMGQVWWGEPQYGKDIPSALFCASEHCADGHRMETYPACLNTIDMQKVAEHVAHYIHHGI